MPDALDAVHPVEHAEVPATNRESRTAQTGIMAGIFICGAAARDDAGADGERRAAGAQLVHRESIQQE